jgi:cysteate synthase
LWIPDDKDLYRKAKEYVRVVFVEQPGNYLHANMLSKRLFGRLDGNIVEEGGYFNCGRLSGLGCCAMEFFDEVGELPKHYFQAVGSGSGALAAIRTYGLLDQYKSRKICFHLSQNVPYIPLVTAINKKDDKISTHYHKFVDTACSPMLTSGDPAYNYSGGLLEHINNGTSIFGYGVSNAEIYKMQYEMWNVEKIQILLPAATALAGMVIALKEGKIKADDIIQVNITGCGSFECMAEKGFFYLHPSSDSSAPVEACIDDMSFNKWYDESQEMFHALC